MFAPLRELRSKNPDGLRGVVMWVNQVVRSKPEIDAETPPHQLVFLTVGEEIYVDVVDVEREEPLQKGDEVSVTWRDTAEGDGMPLLK